MLCLAIATALSRKPSTWHERKTRWSWHERKKTCNHCTCKLNFCHPGSVRSTLEKYKWSQKAKMRTSTTTSSPRLKHLLAQTLHLIHGTTRVVVTAALRTGVPMYSALI